MITLFPNAMSRQTHYTYVSGFDTIQLNIT
jgi:hypothetical protein